MKYAGHVMPHASYVNVCECAASGKMRRLSSSLSSDIGPSMSQIVS